MTIKEKLKDRSFVVVIITISIYWVLLMVKLLTSMTMSSYLFLGLLVFTLYLITLSIIFNRIK